MSEIEAQELGTSDVARPEREGLPSTYRMRADSHYVELLASSGGRAERRAEPRAVQEESRLRPADRLADERLFNELADGVSAIESAAAMLGSEASPLARRVSLDLIRAQAARAAWLLRAQALLAGRSDDLPPRTMPAAAMLGQIRERVAAECRLVGVGVEITADRATDVTADEALLTLGVTGAVVALLGVLAGIEAATLRLGVTAAPDGDLQVIEVSQDVAALTSTARQRFFDAEWLDRPGGWVATVGARVARRAAERLGGGVTLVADARRGCTIRFRFA